MTTSCDACPPGPEGQCKTCAAIDADYHARIHRPDPATEMPATTPGLTVKADTDAIR